MDVACQTASTFIRHAFDQLLAVAERVGDPLVNVRPLPDTNAVGALVIHCCGLTEFWLGHVALGEPSDRDRLAEFTATAELGELRALVASTLDRASDHLTRLAAGDGTPIEQRPYPIDGDRSDDAVVIHVIEECFQHLGHAEIAADMLLTGP